MLGDVLKPRSFAGLFGAAPSMAIATLSLTILNEGSYTAAESRSHPRYVAKAMVRLLDGHYPIIAHVLLFFLAMACFDRKRVRRDECCPGTKRSYIRS